MNLSPIVVLTIASVVYCAFLMFTNHLADGQFPFCFHPVKCADYEKELSMSISPKDDACDDLYVHVCRNWRRMYPLYVDQWNVLQVRTWHTAMELLLKPRDSAKSVLDKTAVGFQRCIEVVSKDAHEPDAIKDLFAKYHFQWPSTQLQKEFDLADFAVGLPLDYGIPVLFELRVLPYYRTDKKYSLALSAAPGFIRRDYPPGSDVGELDIDSCIQEFDSGSSVSDAGTTITTFWDAVQMAEDTANVEFAMTYMKLADFKSITPTIAPADWVKAINKHLPKKAQVSESDEVLVDAKAVPMLRQVLPQYKSKLADMMLAVGFNVVTRLSAAFSYPVLKCMDAMYTTLSTMTLKRFSVYHTVPCLGLMVKLAPFAVARVIYDEILDKKSVDATKEVLANVRKAMAASFENFKNATEVTRAKERLSSLIVVEAMSSHFSDPKAIEGAYSFLPSFDKTFMVDYLEASRLKMNKAKELLTTPASALPIKREDIEVEPIRGESEYLLGAHVVFVPGVLMQAPFISPDVPTAVAYGGIGHDLSTAIMKAFDPVKSAVTSKVEKNDIYTENSLMLLQAYLGCLSFQIKLIAEQPSKHSSSQDFADSMGLSKVSQAFYALKNKGAGMLDYTPEQLFFVSSAFKRCAIDSMTSSDDRYSPPQLRASFSAVNVEPKFIETFKCSATIGAISCRDPWLSKA